MRSFFTSIDREPKEKASSTHSSGPPAQLQSNAQRNQFLRANGVKPQQTNQSMNGRISDARMTFLEASGMIPSSAMKQNQQQSERPSEFEAKKPLILRHIFGSAGNYSNLFSTLRAQVKPWTADEASELVGATMTTISRAVYQMDALAEDADGGQFKLQSSWTNTSSVRQDFDRAVANLSGVMQKYRDLQTVVNIVQPLVVKLRDSSHVEMILVDGMKP